MIFPASLELRMDGGDTASVCSYLLQDTWLAQRERARENLLGKLNKETSASKQLRGAVRGNSCLGLARYQI